MPLGPMQEVSHLRTNIFEKGNTALGPNNNFNVGYKSTKNRALQFSDSLDLIVTKESRTALEAVNSCFTSLYLYFFSLFSPVTPAI